MQYNRIERHLIGNGLSGRFVRQTLDRLLKIELAYGFDLDILVGDDNMMTETLVGLEWRIGNNDLDNFQNAIRHYYEMLHGHEFPYRVLGNRRLRD